MNNPRPRCLLTYNVCYRHPAIHSIVFTLLLCSAFAGATAFAGANSDSTLTKTSKEFAIPETKTIEDLTALPQALRQQLDRLITPISRQSQQVAALHQLLFGRDHLNIQYRNDYTKTAEEVLQTGSGNCLSLASLYVGAARHLGLDARFQLVKTPEQWAQNEQFNIIFGHVNVKVKLPSQDATVEFVNTFTAEESSRFSSKVISDEELVARYYNNRGAELLSSDEIALGTALLKKAAEIHPKFTELWVNLGVAHKLSGRWDEAEAAYLKAYQYNHGNYSALNNLQALYDELGEKEKAQKIAPKIRRHQMRNPYYLALLSEKALQNGNAKLAQKYLKKAIRIHPAEAKFYTLLGQAYFKRGKLDASSKAFKTAVELTTDPDLMKARENKFFALNRIMAQR